MKMRVVLPLAAICLAHPAEAAPLLANETELHIETHGEVKAISATLSQTVHVAKRGKDYCDKEVAEKVAEVKAQLRTAGLPDAAIAVVAQPCTDTGKIDVRFNSFDPDAMVLPNLPQTTDPEELARRADAKRRAALPLYHSQVTVTARVDDMNTMGAVAVAFNMPFGNGSGATRVFQYAKPYELDRMAYVDALAKARASADTIALAMGAHVVRIARVSNHAAPLALDEAVKFFANMAQQPGRGLPSVIEGTYIVSLAVDYVVSPN